MKQAATGIASIWENLTAGFDISPGPARGATGRKILILGSTKADRAERLTRELALHVAAQASRPVWLIDLDFLGAPQYRAFHDPSLVAHYGALGHALEGSLNQSPPFRASPAPRAADGRVLNERVLFAAHRVGATKLLVTHLRADALRDNSQIEPVPAPDYWDALSAACDYAFVSAPPLSQSKVALTMAPFMDAVLLTTNAKQARQSEIFALSRQCQALGTKLTGIVIVDPSPLQRLMMR